MKALPYLECHYISSVRSNEMRAYQLISNDGDNDCLVFIYKINRHIDRC